jgi:hypothetical protein
VESRITNVSGSKSTSNLSAKKVKESKQRRRSNFGTRNELGLQVFDLDDLDKAFTIMPKTFEYDLGNVHPWDDYHSSADAVKILSGFPRKCSLFHIKVVGN